MSRDCPRRGEAPGCSRCARATNAPADLFPLILITEPKKKRDTPRRSCLSFRDAESKS